MSSRDTETKTRILQAVIRLMTESQGKGVRMGDIAKAAKISRQGIYLHYPSRSELLEAAARHQDEILHLIDRLEPSRTAKSGLERLNAYIAFWGNYLPDVYPMAKALTVAMHADEAAAAAWRDRMEAMREGCAAAIAALESDKVLAGEWVGDEAVDLLWTLLSFENWEQLTRGCGWTTQRYIDHMQAAAQRIFVKTT